MNYEQLRWVSKITAWAKRVGGPRDLIIILMSGGAIVYKISEIGAKAGISYIKGKISESKGLSSNGKVYDVLSYGKSNEDLEFKIGDKFAVLEIDADAVLIEKIGDHNNPYFVSAQFLRTISNFE